MAFEELQQIVENAWENRDRLREESTKKAIITVIEHLDKGEIRVAQQDGDNWIVNQWVKKAVLMYFPIAQMETIEVGPFEFYDKIPLKKNFEQLGVRVVS